MLAIGASAIGFNPLTRNWAHAQTSVGTPLNQPPLLDGNLYLNQATLASYAEDFGGVVHEQPVAVLEPGSVEDLVKMVQFARQNKLRIAARGQGHSLFGQAQVEGGIVIDMRSLHKVHSVEGNRITVDTGCRWFEVINAALGRGLTPPVLTDYQFLTVGGTLSIGGISPTSYRHGAQVDNVVELEVVTGTGEVIRCSDSKNSELFQMALAGQGQCAIVTKATIELVTAPAMVRTFNLIYSDLAVLMKDATFLADRGRFNGVVSFLSPNSNGAWSYVLSSTFYYTPPVEPDNTALLASLHYNPGTEQIVDTTYRDYVYRLGFVPATGAQPALTLLVPASSAEPYIRDAMQAVFPATSSEGVFIQLFAWPTAPFQRPLFRTPAEDKMFGFAVLRAAADEKTAAKMVVQNRTLYEQNRSLGGTFYPFSAFRTSRADWVQHYGPQWDRLLLAKRSYDPDSVLASGPDIFRG